jgi:hypothetical protein
MRVGRAVVRVVWPERHDEMVPLLRLGLWRCQRTVHYRLHCRRLVRNAVPSAGRQRLLSDAHASAHARAAHARSHSSTARTSSLCLTHSIFVFLLSNHWFVCLFRKLLIDFRR